MPNGVTHTHTHTHTQTHTLKAENTVPRTVMESECSLPYSEKFLSKQHGAFTDCEWRRRIEVQTAAVNTFSKQPRKAEKK